MFPFPDKVIKNFGRRTLLGLNCIHSLGFVHTGASFSRCILLNCSPHHLCRC
jgi:hypothetical protein